MPDTKLLQALLRAKPKFKEIKKDKQAAYGSYASLDAIHEAVDPALLAEGLVIFHQVLPAESVLRTTLAHVESGETLSSDLPINLNVNPQQMGGQITYYRRYNIQSLLDIQADEDKDGEDIKNIVSRGAPPAGSNAPRQKPIVQKGPVTDKQVGFMLRRSQEAGWSPEQLDAEIRARYRVGHIKELTPAQFQELLENLSHGPTTQTPQKPASNTPSWVDEDIPF